MQSRICKSLVGTQMTEKNLVIKILLRDAVPLHHLVWITISEQDHLSKCSWTLQKV